MCAASMMSMYFNFKSNKCYCCCCCCCQGCVLEEYSQGVDEKLRGLELESIQDYIAESDNLVDLHKQVSVAGFEEWEGCSAYKQWMLSRHPV
jgi:hypothetical protein